MRKNVSIEIDDTAKCFCYGIFCVYMDYIGGFLKWWYPTTLGFPTKNDHFGVFWGYHHLRKHPYTCTKYINKLISTSPALLFSLHHEHLQDADLQVKSSQKLGTSKNGGL